MRSWPGLAAVGAGLIHLGIAAGSSPLVLIAFALVGAVEAGWGVAALARTPAPRTRLALGGAVLLVAGWVLLLLLDGAHRHGPDARADAAGASAPALPLGAVSGAGLLDLVLAVLLAVALRRGSGAAEREPGPWRFLLGTAAGAGLVAVITASSLASTAIGGQHVH